LRYTPKTIEVYYMNDMVEKKLGCTVAIVILNWNGKIFLQKFLPSVVKNIYVDTTIIVADNASTDDSINFLKQYFPQVEIIENASNEGFAKGYNTALQLINADYFILLNSDVEVTTNWIQPLVQLMQADKNIAACQPKILSYELKNTFEYAGASGGWIDKFGYPFARGRIFEHCESDTQQYNDATECFWASGAALCVRASAFNQVGGFDPYFFAHQEEIDLCWRLQLQGYKIFVQPASIVYHVGGGTLPKTNPKKTYLNFRNNLIMLAKNYPFLTAVHKIFIRFGLDALAAYQGLFTGKPSIFIAIFKAHFQFMNWLFFAKKQRQHNKILKPTLYGVYNGSIVWQYFFKKKKTFSQIIKHK
jgi:GT2 family glycosyltransferase